MIDFSCPACDKRFHVKDELAGKKARCPGCQQIFKIPQVAQQEEVPIASAIEDMQPTSPPPTPDPPQPGNGPMTLLSTKIAPGVTAGFALLTIILFFLPWLKLTCAKTEVGSQSGFQIATGRISLSAEAENLKEKNQARSGSSSPGNRNITKEDSLGSDWPLLFVPGFLLCVMLLGILTIAKSGGLKHVLWTGACGLCLAALILTIVYLAAGFAAERAMDKAKADASAQSSKNTDNPFGAAGRQLGASLVSVDRAPALYCFIVFLVLAWFSSAAAWLLLAKFHGVNGMSPCSGFKRPRQT